MTELDDPQLLAEFARNHSDAAFAALAERHVNLVYSAALRQAGNPHAAEEITQAVFIILARKAKSLGAKTILAGWLHQTTRLTAANYRRGEIRRQKREQEAFMQSALNEPDANVWPQIAPLLDDALGKLGERDRNAIVLRFFENKSLAEIGAALGASEDAAKMRVNRALEKLRKIFVKRGVALTTAIIAGTVAANSVQAAPAGLAKTISAVAITKGAAAGGSTLTLVKGALKIMAWTKTKTAIVVGLAVILAVGTGTMIIKKVISPAYPSSWAEDPAYWSMNNPPLASYPQILILRPTRFSGQGGSIGDRDRQMERNVPIEDLAGFAYGFRYTRLILPEDFPQGGRGSGYAGYDLMLTLRNNPRKALRDEIAKQFGLVGHAETIVTNALLVKVANTDAPGLKRASSAWGQGSSSSSGDNSLTIRNQRLDYFLGLFIESKVHQPVFNETGLTGNYDLHMQWPPEAGETDKHAFERALREQLGFELVPTNMPVEMLVVEKVK